MLLLLLYLLIERLRVFVAHRVASKGVHLDHFNSANLLFMLLFLILLSLRKFRPLILCVLKYQRWLQVPLRINSAAARTGIIKISHVCPRMILRWDAPSCRLLLVGRLVYRLLELYVSDRPVIECHVLVSIRWIWIISWPISSLRSKLIQDLICGQRYLEGISWHLLPRTHPYLGVKVDEARSLVLRLIKHFDVLLHESVLVKGQPLVRFDGGRLFDGS